MTARAVHQVVDAGADHRAEPRPLRKSPSRAATHTHGDHDDAQPVESERRARGRGLRPAAQPRLDEDADRRPNAVGRRRRS